MTPALGLRAARVAVAIIGQTGCFRSKDHERFLERGDPLRHTAMADV
jgi:hypothetical protein